MKKFLKRRGQATLEFAMILPLFAFILFALIYLGFLFIDIVTLDSAAAAAARSAAQNGGEPTDAVIDKIKGTKLFLYWYELDPESPKLISDSDGFITYGVQATLNNDVIKGNYFLGKVLPEKYTVVKTAYKEP